MIFNKFVEIGRVVYVSRGKDEGKLAVIANVVDGTKLLVDGPTTGVQRSVKRYQDIQLTKFKVNIRVGQRSGAIKKAVEEAKIAEEWAKSNWAKNIATRKTRASLNDFQRFKVMRLKQWRNRAISTELNKLRKTTKKA